jgi:RING finger protein 121/175
MLWLIPIFISIYNADLHFILIWASISGLFFYYMSIALFLSFPSNRIFVVTPETPRKVYKFFKICSNATFVCAFGGYLFILGLVMLNVTIPALYEWAFIVIFYGLYFGVLGRDLIQLPSDAMAVSIGYHNPEGIPLRGLQASTCAICGGRVKGVESEFF